VPAAPARDRAQLVVFACQSGLAIPGTSAGPAHCTRGEQITQFGTGSDMPAATPWSSFRRDCAAAALRWWGGRCPELGWSGLGRTTCRRKTTSPRCLHRPACDHRPMMPWPSVTDSWP